MFSDAKKFDCRLLLLWSVWPPDHKKQPSWTAVLTPAQTQITMLLKKASAITYADDAVTNGSRWPSTGHFLSHDAYAAPISNTRQIPGHVRIDRWAPRLSHPWEKCVTGGARSALLAHSAASVFSAHLFLYLSGHAVCPVNLSAPRLSGQLWQQALWRSAFRRETSGDRRETGGDRRRQTTNQTTGRVSETTDVGSSGAQGSNAPYVRVCMYGCMYEVLCMYVWTL